MQEKLAELQDLVETNLAEAAARQKMMYDKHSTYRYFDVGDMVWLSVPTAGKLDPRWEGNWMISAVKSPVTIEITDGKRKKVVHVNRLHHRVQPGCDKGEKKRSALTHRHHGHHHRWNICCTSTNSGAISMQKPSTQQKTSGLF